MPVKRLKEFLDTHSIKYVIISHSRAFTAQETAISAHISGKELAKTVVVKIDGKMTMAVLPSSYKVDFGLLRKVAGASKVEIASEKEFKDLFPGCEIGAMPPFGNLYGMEVFVAESLAEDEDIAFNAGSHRELVKMAYKDFERLVKPKIAKF
ncbi:MAG: YbaK/EbsC family protein [Planctomycetota bacterium]|nr:YbaK/EbsC family protein [Planctomycetota bacterium]MDE1889359.1 YbaK/EbsC family protein [Planctomycetota bacterium]MDE2215693.1 YbaK/EbsC family protein [Planctomycetota bacterium]